MKISAFFKLVEIQTKVASVLPFLFGIVFCVYRYDMIKPTRLIVFFISMLSIDLATTAINNFMDYKRAIHKEGFNYESHNAIVRDGLSNHQVITTIILLIVVGAIFGMTLFLMTDIVVFFIGFIAFGIGIIYSYGPLPISRTPLGEIASGVLMGGFIFFVTVYCQISDLGYFLIFMADQTLHIDLILIEFVVIGVVALPLIFMIANIMLANNICDMEEDVINKRYTLPIYIGKKNAIILFVALHVLSYISILGAIIMGWLPLSSLLVGLTLFPVVKSLKEFVRLQKKATTFVISVKNFILISGTSILTVLISIIIEWLIKF